MPNEIVTTTDWISAIAAAMACIATVALAIIAWKQSIISNRQTTIIGRQTDIFERQAFYQGQQTTISKNQSEIAKRQTEISDQQLTIIKDQEADRKNAAMRADLVITSSAAVGENVLDMILENKGPGWAREIQVYLNGCTLREYPPEICRLAPGSVEQTEIGPGNTLNNLWEFPGENPPPNLRVDIKWVSDNGISSTNLGFINPRQQLEVYKKEHLKTTSMPENGPRMEAYTKFVEIMSAGTIDAHDATTKIVPRFETILLLSSPEVKRIAKAIRDEEMAGGKIKNMPGFVHRIREELMPIIKTEIENS